MKYIININVIQAKLIFCIKMNKFLRQQDTWEQLWTMDHSARALTQNFRYYHKKYFGLVVFEKGLLSLDLVMFFFK